MISSSIWRDSLYAMVDSDTYHSGTQIKYIGPGALALGARPLMTVARAFNISEEIRVVSRNRRFELKAIHDIERLIYGISPCFEIGKMKELGWFYIDVRGLSHIWGSLEQIQLKIVRSFSGLGYETRVAIAPSLYWAKIVARNGGGLFSRIEDILGGGIGIHCLDCSKDFLTLMIRMGVHTIDDFVTLPLNRLGEHLGREALEIRGYLDGTRTDRILEQEKKKHVFFSEVELEEPIHDFPQLEKIVLAEVERLMKELLNHSLACLSVSFKFSYIGIGEYQKEITLPQAIRHLDTLKRICVRQLESELPCQSIEVVSVELVPSYKPTKQLSLFDVSSVESERLQSTLSRLWELYERNDVGCPVLSDDYLEDSWVLKEPGNLMGHFDNKEDRRGTPGCLRRLRPPVEVRVGYSLGRPKRIGSTMLNGTISKSFGPFRTSISWWSADGFDELGRIFDIYDIAVRHKFYRLGYNHLTQKHLLLGVYD
ncbi:MAG: hypothetical protein VYA34_15700 [Myxococcota bacterium]|nr:hypothetical protein [Myxococcota bacterium]